MISFFRTPSNKIYAVQTTEPISPSNNDKLLWLFGGAEPLSDTVLEGIFIGPRATMITPWSTNAVEITQNMAISGIQRIEAYTVGESDYDPMLSQKYNGLGQNVFDINIKPESVQQVENISAYNEQEGLSLNEDEIDYLCL